MSSTSLFITISCDFYGFSITYSPSDRRDYDQKLTHPPKKTHPQFPVVPQKLIMFTYPVDMVACTLSVKWEMCFDTIMAKPNYFSWYTN